MLEPLPSLADNLDTLARELTRYQFASLLDSLFTTNEAAPVAAETAQTGDTE